MPQIIAPPLKSALTAAEGNLHKNSLSFEYSSDDASNEREELVVRFAFSASIKKNVKGKRSSVPGWGHPDF